MKSRLHVPAGEPPPGGFALLVALHGCTQSAEDFARGTRFDALADAYGLIVLYPQQSMRRNPRRCWNWFLPENQRRDGAEPAGILELVEQTLASHPIDRGRVAVTGLSAGGSMAAILIEQAPEVFSAAGIVAGVALHAASDVESAFAQMNDGSQPALTIGRAVGDAERFARTRVQIWSGDADRVVDPRNAQVLAEQFGALLRVADPPEAGGDATLEVQRWRDRAGRVRVELRTLRGLGHVWSGGSLRGSHTAPSGPDISFAMLPFLFPQPSPRAPERRTCEG